MAKHKAATDVTIASLTEKSPFEQWVARYWVHGTILSLAIVGFVTFRHFREQSVVTAKADSWNRLLTETEPDPQTNVPTVEGENGGARMAELAAELKGTAAGPAARAFEVFTHLRNEDFDAASKALATLESDYPDHLIFGQEYRFEVPDGDGTKFVQRTLREHLDTILAERATWTAQHASVFTNPPPPEDAPRVRIETAEGAIVIALYEKEAPKHVANFLKLTQEGFYDGTKFHRVDPNFMIQGGDPNSREDDRSQWGQGGAGYKIDPERNMLRHFEGYLSMAKQSGDAQSSGSQFFILVKDSHHLDGQHVVFGKVLEGQEVAVAIAGAELQAGTRDQPAEPVTIEKISIP